MSLSHEVVFGTQIVRVSELVRKANNHAGIARYFMDKRAYTTALAYAGKAWACADMAGDDKYRSECQDLIRACQHQLTVRDEEGDE